MPTVSSEYLNQLDAFLIARGLRADRNHLLESKNVHYLMFHGMNRDAKGPPVSVRLASERDDPLELVRFLGAKAVNTRFGVATKVFIQGVVSAGLDETSQMIRMAYDTPSGGGQTVGIEWIGEWLVFDPAKRLREIESHLKIRASDLLEESPQAAVTVTFSEPVQKEEVAEARRPAVPRSQHGQSGIVFEDRLAEEMSFRGIAFASSNALDRLNKTDFLIVHCDGISQLRPIALQVTLRWNDMLKMRSFRYSGHGLRVKKRQAVAVYLQVNDKVSPAEVAEAIREIAASHCSYGAGGKMLFAEIDCDGWHTFNPEHRLQRLSSQANPHVTESVRASGTVVEVKTNGLRVQGEGKFRSWTFWSFISEIADEKLLVLFRDHNAGHRDISGLRVSLIPEMKQSSGDRRAKSVILAA